ncbi:MAG TPA: hypothetical protein VFW94_17845, partial [Candidatus Acidoferrales bacterium]|nr:hypothetical protein [Candidatus Acidoferrales bacterium]
YRLCRRLVVLSRGRVAAFGDMEEIFRRPPNADVARLTGCKNISRAKPAANGLVEAIDWGCRLRVAECDAPAYAIEGANTATTGSLGGRSLPAVAGFSSDIAVGTRSQALAPEASAAAASIHQNSAAPAYVGIRAHHIDFVEPSASGASSENVFPCWLVRSSETPFRITLFLSLREPAKRAAVDSVAPGRPESSRAEPDSHPFGGSHRRFSHSSSDAGDNFDLQAEVFKEKWERFRNEPQPWHVHLPPSALFSMPE